MGGSDGSTQPTIVLVGAAPAAAEEASVFDVFDVVAWTDRTVRVRSSVLFEVGEELTVVEHGYTHFTITLHALHCTHIAGEPQALGVAAFRWIAPADLDALPWPRTDRKIIEARKAEAEAAAAAIELAEPREPASFEAE